MQRPCALETCDRAHVLLTDAAIDALVPDEVRHLSAMHWTPVAAASRVAELVALRDGERLLDVGAGAGKLCCTGAMLSRGAWCGIEQNSVLVAAAAELASALGVADRARVVHGDAFAIDWDAFDVLYFYNPFEQPLFGGNSARERFMRARARLAELHVGMRVVTLNGLGAAMPSGFEQVSCERVAGVGLDLELWIRRDATTASR
jgi:hypothetical protein